MGAAFGATYGVDDGGETRGDDPPEKRLGPRETDGDEGASERDGVALGERVAGGLEGAS